MDDGLPPTDDAGTDLPPAAPAPRPAARGQRGGDGQRAGRGRSSQARTASRAGRAPIDPLVAHPSATRGAGRTVGPVTEGDGRSRVGVDDADIDHARDGVGDADITNPAGTRRKGVMRNDRLDDDLDTALHRGPVVLPAIVPAEVVPDDESTSPAPHDDRNDPIGLFDDGADVIDVDPFAPGLVGGPPPTPYLPAGNSSLGGMHDDLIVPPSPLTPEPVRPALRPAHGPRVRRVTRVVRHVDTWSVFKVALVFNVFLYVVALTSGVFLWQVAQNTGTIDNIERFFESFGWQTFELHGGEIYHNAWVAGLFLVVGMTGFAVLLATLFNLITDLVGGIRISVLEEEVVSRDERGTNPARAAVLTRLERLGRGERSDRGDSGGRVRGTNPFRRRG